MGPVVDLRTLRDIGPGGGHTDAYRNTCDEESAQQHGEIDTADNECHTQHVDKEIIGVNELTSVLIGQETSDDGSDGCSQAVGADEVEPT